MAGNLGNFPASAPVMLGPRSLFDLQVEMRLLIWRHVLELNQTPLDYCYVKQQGHNPPSIQNYYMKGMSDLQNYSFQLMILEHMSKKTFMRATRENNDFFKTLRKFESRQDRILWCANTWMQREFQLKAPVQPTSITSITRTHSMVLVCKQLGAEYRQVYYESTKFEFNVTTHNVLRALPSLAEENRPEDNPNGLFPTLNCWGVSNDLFPNLRRCDLHIGLTNIELAMYSDPSQEEDIILDAYLDNSITQTVKALIASMHQVRQIHLAWITHVPGRLPLTVGKRLNLPYRKGLRIDPRRSYGSLSSEPWFPEHTTAIEEYNWNLFVKEFALVLMRKSSLRDLSIICDTFEFESKIDSSGKWSPSQDHLNAVRYFRAKKLAGPREEVAPVQQAAASDSALEEFDFDSFLETT